MLEACFSGDIMRRRSLAFGAFASLALALPSVAFATEFGTAQSTTMQWGNATVTLGGGLQRLYIPDVNFIQGSIDNGPTRALPKLDTNDLDGELGFGFNGVIEIPSSLLGASSWAIQGFYGSVSHDNNVVCAHSASLDCTATPIIDDGSIKVSTDAFLDNALTTRSERDVSVWGVALEGKRHLNGTRQYWALGGDIRGINQSLDLSQTFGGLSGIANYDEDLDTTYYGIYLAYGSDYSLPFLGGLKSRLGLQQSFRLWGGVYYADTDYSGTYGRNIAAAAIGDVDQRLNLSDDDAAFIGGLTLETRKPIGPRTALTLRGDYEYYSYVPQMRYNETVNGTGGSVTGTSIDDDDGFSLRSTLNLRIGLGPDALYADTNAAAY